MIIDKSQQDSLSVHLVATAFGRARLGAPQPVHRAVAALVDPTEIVGSHATYGHLRPTRWRVWVATSTHLAYVEMEFDEDDYDAQEEIERIKSQAFSNAQSFAAARLVSAWARPLVTATDLTASRIDQDYIHNAPGPFRLQDIAIKFADGTRVPAEGGLSFPTHPADEDGERWDAFVAAIRDGSRYATVELKPEAPFRNDLT